MRNKKTFSQSKPEGAPSTALVSKKGIYDAKRFFLDVGGHRPFWFIEYIPGVGLNKVHGPWRADRFTRVRGKTTVHVISSNPNLIAQGIPLDRLLDEHMGVFRTRQDARDHFRDWQQYLTRNPRGRRALDQERREVSRRRESGMIGLDMSIAAMASEY